MTPIFSEDTSSWGYDGRCRPIMDEADAIEELERQVASLIRAGTAMVRAQTQVERVAAIHDWSKLIESISK